MHFEIILNFLKIIELLKTYHIYICAQNLFFILLFETSMFPCRKISEAQIHPNLVIFQNKLKRPKTGFFGWYYTRTQ